MVQARDEQTADADFDHSVITLNTAGVTDALFSVAVLAGGTGRRLGGIDKGALLVDGQPIRARLIAEASRVASDVFVVAPRDVPAALEPVRIVYDRWPNEGALAALATALEASSTDIVVVVAGDMPHVSGAFLQWLAGRLTVYDAVVPVDAGGRHPLCAVYHRRGAARLINQVQSGVRRVQQALHWLTVDTVRPEDYAAFDPDGHLLLNINTFEDYHAALDRQP
jgi:molybdopterin-guanine dinucleotide biosynthesis protein A